MMVVAYVLVKMTLLFILTNAQGTEMTGSNWSKPCRHPLFDSVPLPALAVFETGSVLVLPDMLAHPSFCTASRLDGTRCFVGVPLVIDGVSVGVLCTVATEPVDLQPEDLTLLRLFSDLATAVLCGSANGRTSSELPTRYGPGIAVPSMFEEMLDAELRLLDNHGGSIELAVLDSDVDAARGALAVATERSRLFGGALNDRRIALYKRGRNGETEQQLTIVLDSLRAHKGAQAVGLIDLAARGLHVFSASELIRLAELALDRTLATGGVGIHRLLIEEQGGEAGSKT